MNARTDSRCWPWRIAVVSVVLVQPLVAAATWMLSTPPLAAGSPASAWHARRPTRTTGMVCSSTRCHRPATAPPALLSGDVNKVKQRLYWDPSPFRHLAAKFEGQPGWRVTKLPCSRDAMVDMPLELARELMALA